MKLLLSRASAAAGVLVASTVAADAHIVAARLGDFYAGALHPFTDLQDVVLWLALGVLAGSLGAARGRWLILLFPLGLVAGLSLANTSGLIPEGPAVDAGMILVLGLLVAAQARLSTGLLAAVAFALAVVRGTANGDGLDPATDRLLFGAGLASAGYVAITLTMALTLAFRRSDGGERTAWRGIAIRALGGWIAAIGLMMAGLAFSSHVVA
jgi:urease accessory protein